LWGPLGPLILKTSRSFPPSESTPPSRAPQCCTEIAREQPPFDQDQHDILMAGKCTAFLIIYERQPDATFKPRHFGTAFFITEKYLLTAGHNVIDRRGAVRHPHITYPGLKFIDTKMLREGKIALLECTVVEYEHLHNRNGQSIPYPKDFAILKCSGHKAAYYLPISSDPLPPVVTVDIIGYPGAIKEEWMEKHQHLNDYVASKRDTEVLLPTRSMTVTRGTVKGYDGVLISYHISTCPGLSGACMLYKGKAFGIVSSYCAYNRGASRPRGNW
jgi:V8-like Glu-specific endopeptidase